MNISFIPDSNLSQMREFIMCIQELVSHATNMHANENGNKVS